MGAFAVVAAAVFGGVLLLPHAVASGAARAALNASSDQAGTIRFSFMGEASSGKGAHDTLLADELERHGDLLGTAHRGKVPAPHVVFDALGDSRIVARRRRALRGSVGADRQRYAHVDGALAGRAALPT